MTAETKKTRTSFARNADTAAKWVITIGGGMVIVCVILIMFLIVGVTIPLFTGSSASVHRTANLPVGMQAGDVAAIGVSTTMDFKASTAVLATRSGKIVFADVLMDDKGSNTPRIIKEELIPVPSGAEGQEILSIEKFTDKHYSVVYKNGAAVLLKANTLPVFDKEGNRSIMCYTDKLGAVGGVAKGEVSQAMIRVSEDYVVTRAALLEGGSIEVSRKIMEDEEDEEAGEEKTILTQNAGHIISMAMTTGGTDLYVGTDNGCLLWWRLDDGEIDDDIQPQVIPAFFDKRKITSLCMMFGDVSLAVGDEKGGVSTWFAVANVVNGSRIFKLKKIHVLSNHEGVVTSLLSSRRTKSLLSLDELGRAALDHMTSERRLIDFKQGSPIVLAALDRTDNSMLTLDGGGKLTLWDVQNDHPEVSWRTLLGKVHYEGYSKADLTWQTTGGEDFEPKFSIIPAFFGTLKGTLYAMLLAVPLSILGAMYTSQFTTPEFKALIKPVVEIMAAVPSVVIGFLIALWLAPIVETWVVGIFLAFITIPVTFIIFMTFWQFLRTNDRVKRIEHGKEFMILIPVLIIGVLLAVWMAPFTEHMLFHPESFRNAAGDIISWQPLHNFGEHISSYFNSGPKGDFQAWLFAVLGETYEQRNSVIIAFGLGFAIMPIIFSISEDALSAVPYNLRAASMALGASRWQTVWRVILPSASPGIFAATMIGLGRAVGETMIVLMATGNTPIIDISPFNGMQTLSAVIAEEIPEAPVGGTLYRTLFLCAVLLFILTFSLNTIAELVRQHLRKKYGQF